MAGIPLKGRDLSLKLDSSVFGSGTDWSLNPNVGLIEYKTFGTSGKTMYLPNNRTYTLSVNGVLFRNLGGSEASPLNLLNKMWNTDTSISWTGTLDSSTTQVVSGWGYMTGLPISVPVEDMATCSIEIQGCGDLTINTSLA